MQIFLKFFQNSQITCIPSVSRKDGSSKSLIWMRVEYGEEWEPPEALFETISFKTPLETQQKLFA